LIIVKIATKKFHLQKMDPLISPAKGQWGLRARGKSILRQAQDRWGRGQILEFRLQIGDRQNRLNWHRAWGNWLE